MRILVGKCFGLGNAVMSVPMLRALSTIGTVDVLAGTGPDDVGALDVFLSLQRMGIIDDIYTDAVDGVEHDVAIMAIPFDGRWRNGIHFRAERVMDCRPRPDFSPELGFSSWKRHEVEYQVDNACELGFTGPTPSMGFHPDTTCDSDVVYLGLGFKRDASSFWSAKHWGNDRYISFIRTVSEIRPSVRFMTTGNIVDLTQCIMPIARAVGCVLEVPSSSNITAAFSVAASCGSYFGNDTGMMHVAASLDRPTYGLMAYENVVIKNRPWCSRWMVHEFFRDDWGPERVADEFVRFVWGKD